MNELIVQLPRRVIPRWRDFSTTVALGEMGVTGQIAPARLSPIADLSEAKANWKAHKSAFVAGDLLAAAMVEQDWPLAMEAANFLTREEIFIPSFTRELARTVLNWHSNRHLHPPTSSSISETPLFNSKTIGLIRRTLANYPRSPIHWVELALGYTIIGKPDKAERAILTALHLAPMDRFVVRSATRFFLHRERPEMAKRILMKCRATAHDPWLLSAHLSVANILSEVAKYHKQARVKFDEQKIPHFHLSELGVALATDEIRYGNEKRGRRLFSQALVDPTENAVAQALWAKNKVALEQHDSLLNRPFSFEANARYQVQIENWEGAIIAARKWQNDEPFSARPAILGSFLACTVLENYTIAEEVARSGLVANPGEATLTNNLVYALACAGHVDEARITLFQHPRSSLDKETEVVFTATEGLLEYRSGKIAAGKEKYLAAIRAAKLLRNTVLELRAAIQLGREELRANSVSAPTYVQEILELTKNNKDPSTRIVANKLIIEATKAGIIDSSESFQTFPEQKFALEA